MLLLFVLKFHSMISCRFLINPIILSDYLKKHWICSSNLILLTAKQSKAKCLWSWTWWTGLPLKLNDGFGLKLIFRINTKSWACLQGSGLKLIFHFTAHSEKFVRSLFRLTVPVVISCTVKNKEVVVSKKFWIKLKRFDKSFMSIKNKKYQKNWSLWDASIHLCPWRELTI